MCALYCFIVSNFDVCIICKHFIYVGLDFVSIESLCVNEGSLSDESSDDETAKGNLH